MRSLRQNYPKAGMKSRKTGPRRNAAPWF